ncbi:hypothetical protein LK12_05125 [Novosphingobium malaysiense]|uniref:EF-hand domain-containing protein n=2 Tax=Novosphingobium malaysiense TaxID=1348853 RepID=A0A0B1ZNT2_9SPHN|nr:hypothetical protein LK12_05125 [Novosphingobium malaysiense]
MVAVALTLSACDSQDVENTPIDDVDEIVDSDEGYPVAGDMNEQQQAAFDAMDREAAVREYDENRAAMQAESPSASRSTQAATGSGSSGEAPGGSGGSTTSTASDGSAMNAGSDQNDTAAPDNAGVSSSPLRPRSAMDFAFLDRNDDGQLSVAEYAIWAVRSDPTEPKPNDETRPYTTQDQINEAGQTFFYFDKDADTYLSPEEFSAARASARTPN